jgi:hypothetical protein
MIWPPYQPTVYVERQHDYQVEAPCEWYQDLESAGGEVYCRTPAMWLVVAAVGAGTLLVLATRKR